MHNPHTARLAEADEARAAEIAKRQADEAAKRKAVFMGRLRKVIRNAICDCRELTLSHDITEAVMRFLEDEVRR